MDLSFRWVAMLTCSSRTTFKSSSTIETYIFFQKISVCIYPGNFVDQGVIGLKFCFATCILYRKEFHCTVLMCLHSHLCAFASQEIHLIMCACWPACSCIMLPDGSSICTHMLDFSVYLQTYHLGALSSACMLIQSPKKSCQLVVLVLGVGHLDNDVSSVYRTCFCLHFLYRRYKKVSSNKMSPKLG